MPHYDGGLRRDASVESQFNSTEFKNVKPFDKLGEALNRNFNFDYAAALSRRT